MDFSFSQEQLMLQEATRRFLMHEYHFEARRALQQTPAQGRDSVIWKGFADLGLLSLLIPEQDGGLGGNGIDTLLVMGAMGESLVLEPFLSGAVMASNMIALLGSAQQRAEFLPAMAAGEQLVVMAHDEPATRFDRLAITTTATQLEGTYLLQGHKCLVSHAACADYLLVTATIASATSGTSAISTSASSAELAVFLVPRDAPGLRLTSYSTVDGMPASEVWLEQVQVSEAHRLSLSDASSQISQVLDTGLAAVCAEAVGALDKLLAATVEYTKNRRQFGTAIGQFQALQHRMADMVLHIEQARSMSYLAAMSADDPDPETRGLALSAAKVVIGQACRFVGQQAVQLHGGMGVTDELDVSHYFKRLMAIELQFGNTDQHLEHYAEKLS